MAKLTQGTKGVLLNRIVNHWSDPIEQDMLKEEYNLVERIIQYALLPNGNKFADCPQCWFPLTNRIFWYARLDDGTEEDQILHVSNFRRLPSFLTDGYNDNDDGRPDLSQFADEVLTLRKKLLEHDKRRCDLRRKIKGVLRNVNTDAQLKDTWPEAIAFLNLSAEAVPNLPEIRIADLNGELGLALKEAAA